MIDGERNFITAFNYQVSFEPSSTIKIFRQEDDGSETFVQLDPTDLSIIYAAYCQMQRELEELKTAKNK